MQEEQCQEAGDKAKLEKGAQQTYDWLRKNQHATKDEFDAKYKELSELGEAILDGYGMNWGPLGVQLYTISTGGSSWGSRSRSSGARRGFKGERTHLSPFGPSKTPPKGHFGGSKR